MAGSAAGRGLAAAYPSDVGIEQDPDVLWAESFEEPSVAALTARYTSAQNPANLQLIRDAPSGAGQSLEVTATPSSTGGGLYRSLGAGHDEVYLRYYIRYSNAAYHHTTVNVGGVNPSVQPWVTQGPVGLCCTAPDGDKALSVSAEVFSRSGGTFAFDFYNYWWEMRSWGNVVTPPTGSTERDPLTGQNKVPAAGNTFLSGVEPRLAFDRWYAIEVHVKLNTPPARDGVLALWIDGRLVHEFRAGSPMGQYVGTNFSPSPGGAPFPGLSYRSSTALTLNYLWITHYATQVPPGTTTSVHYDQLVLAKRYIGPMAP